MQKKGREVASCLFHNLSPFICTCSRCRFFMLEVAAKTASRYFFPKIARYRFCIRGLGVYELCLYPIKAFFDCEAPPGDVFCTHIACFHNRIYQVGTCAQIGHKSFLLRSSKKQIRYSQSQSLICVRKYKICKMGRNFHIFAL